MGSSGSVPSPTPDAGIGPSQFGNEMILAELKSLHSSDPARAEKLLQNANAMISEAKRTATTGNQVGQYLHQKVEPIITPLIRQIAQERPPDVKSWLIHTLTQTALGEGDECHLRIFAVNDVYELDNMPHLRTLISQTRTRNTIVCLAGDFVAPSVLSSLDNGRGMVDCLNLVGFTHVCFGNHEADIPHAELKNRIEQFNGKWLNSNMTDINWPDSTQQPSLPPYDVVTVRGGKKGQHVRRVGLLGLLSNDPATYQSSAFNGATITDVNDTAAKLKDQLLRGDYQIDHSDQGRKSEDELAGTVDQAGSNGQVQRTPGVDVVIPMTHQYIPEDRGTCEDPRLRFPLIIGGHDHEVFQEKIFDTTVLKAGSDAEHCLCIDVRWKDERSEKSPEITYELLNTRDFKPNRLVQAAVNKHKGLVRVLEELDLCERPANVIWSSQNMRLQATTIGTLICTALRKNLMCDVVLINGGAIRGDAKYSDAHKWLTYADLKREIPFETEMAVLSMPGSVIAEAVRFSRQYAQKADNTLHDRKGSVRPVQAKSMFLQTDSGVKVSGDPLTSGAVTHIKHVPLQPERHYRVGIPYTTLQGMDRILPIIEWVENNPSVVPPEDCGRPAKALLVDQYSKQMWNRIFSSSYNSHVSDIQIKDGKLTKNELSLAIQRQMQFDAGGSDLLAEHMINVFTGGSGEQHLTEEQITQAMEKLHREEQEDEHL